MESHLVVVFTTAMIQGSFCFLMALVLGRLSWTYGRRAIHIIALGWLALAVSFVAAAASVGMVTAGYPASHPIRLVITAAGLAAAYGQAALLIVGAIVVIRGRHISPWVWVGLSVAIAAVVVMATLSFQEDPARLGLRILVRVGLRNLVTGIAFVAGALVLRRASRPPGIGHPLVVVGFVLYGAQQLVGFGVTLASVLGRNAVMIAGLSTVVESIWLGMIGIGTVVWLLELESDRLRRASRDLEGLTQIDQVTGAATRRRFLTSLGLACRQGRLENHVVAVIAADVDGFRKIVTALGRGASDELLRVVADRFRRVVPEASVLARLERDEFGLAFAVPRGRRGQEVVTGTIRSLRDVVRPPFVVGGQEVFATVSVGVALCPHDGDRPEALLRAAEAALETAKARGPDQVQHFDPGLSSLSWERLHLETALRRALQHQQLELHYQPVVDLPSRELRGFEALLRWRHPERGLLRPSEFLGIAEAAGILAPIERWVLAEAAVQRHRWQHLVPPDFQVGLNLSPEVFHQPDAESWIRKAVANAGAEPEQLTLEITESHALVSTEQVVSGLASLAGAGFTIALDDFGTGYSSLSSLRQIPATTVKIDRSFARAIDESDRDRSFVRNICGLAHAVGMMVVVEGVERESQAVAACGAECDRAQGYLFGLPVPADTATSILGG